MFATSIKYIIADAGHELASTVQAFFMSATIVRTLYRYPCTPVHRLNGHAASAIGCDRQRDRHGYLLFLLCYNINRFPTPHCLATTERQPTKRARTSVPSRGTPTPTLPAWGWTCTIAASATAARPTRTGRPSPAPSTSAERATPWEPPRTPNSSKESAPNGKRSRRGTGCAVRINAYATRWPSSTAIRTLPYCPPTCRNGRHRHHYTVSSPRGSSPAGAARDGYTPTATTIYQPNNNRTNHGNKDHRKSEQRGHPCHK